MHSRSKLFFIFFGCLQQYRRQTIKLVTIDVLKKGIDQESAALFHLFEVSVFIPAKVTLQAQQVLIVELYFFLQQIPDSL